MKDPSVLYNMQNQRKFDSSSVTVQQSGHLLFEAVHYQNTNFLYNMISKIPAIYPPTQTRVWSMRLKLLWTERHSLELTLDKKKNNYKAVMSALL